MTDPNVKLVPVPLGNSSKVRVGEPVAAIGSPFLEAGSLSVGVVSAINRSLASGTAFQIPGAIQTDAAINHGNSGGPLFNAAGEVIGINAQIQSTSGGGEGVGFAVPIDLAERSMKQLVETGHVAYGWLGVRLGTITPAVADQFELSVTQGALIEEVTPGGPAQQAGLVVGDKVEHFQDGSLRPNGDVIVSVDGVAVTSSDQFVRLVATRDPGEVLHLKVARDGHTRMVRCHARVRARCSLRRCQQVHPARCSRVKTDATRQRRTQVACRLRLASSAARWRTRSARSPSRFAAGACCTSRRPPSAAAWPRSSTR